MGSLKINAGATSLKYIETFYSFGIQDNYILDRTKSYEIRSNTVEVKIVKQF